MASFFSLDIQMNTHRPDWLELHFRRTRCLWRPAWKQVVELRLGDPYETFDLAAKPRMTSTGDDMVNAIILSPKKMTDHPRYSTACPGPYEYDSADPPLAEPGKVPSDCVSPGYENMVLTNLALDLRRCAMPLRSRNPFAGWQWGNQHVPPRSIAGPPRSLDEVTSIRSVGSVSEYSARTEIFPG